MLSNSNIPGSGFFSGSSFLEEKNKSGRSLVYSENDHIPLLTYTKFKELFKKEMAFKILQNSKFLTKIIKGNQVSINYESITIEDGNDQINKTINEIEAITSNNEVLNNNYIKFKEVLNKFEKRIRNGLQRNGEFKILINFTSSDFYKHNLLNLSCNYTLIVPGERDLSYEDTNILLDGGLNDGIFFLLEEMNNDN